MALPFAPVIAQQTEVQWPASGESARSTTALFAPYRPAEFRLEVPCSIIQNSGAEPVTLLSTVPAHSPREGLTLTAHNGRPSLRMGERAIPLPNLPEVPANAARDACLLEVSSTSQAPGHTRIDVGGTGVTPLRSMELPGLPAPEIFQFQTSLGTAEAAGLKVTARTFSWFDTSPTALKAELISAAVGFAVIALLLLMQHRPPRVPLARAREAFNRQRFRRVPVHLALGLLDLAVLAVFAGWAIIGPLTDDDGFAMLTIRNFQDAGDIGNFYRWFNASETPFTLVQHLMYGLIDNGYVSLAPLALRTPSVVAGVLTWLVLSRGIVQPLCRLQGWRRVPLHLVTAVFFLATWLPFNLGIRPEAFVTLGMCLVFALLLRATGGDPDQPRARFAWLGLAAGATGLTLAVTPTAVAALFVVALFAPRIARLLWTVPEGSAAPRWLVVPTRALLVASVGGLGLVAMFADSTWNGVKQATHIHNEFGPSMGWYQEINRYSSLLGTESWGAAGKRMAVLLVLAALLISAVGVLRSLHQRAQLGSLPLLWGSVAGIFLALWLTPSKWSHHFGSLAGLGAALLAVTLVLLMRAGRADSAASSRTPALLGIVGTIAGSLAAALAFMGPNEWWRYSDMAMAWSDTPVALPQLPLNDPLLWALVAACVGLLTLGIVATGNVLRVRRGQQPAAEHAPRDPSTDPIPVLTADSAAISAASQNSERRPPAVWSALPWTGMPASVLTLAALSSVAVLLGTFAAAPASLPHSYSIARANWDSLVDRSCGIEPEVETLPLAEQQPIAEGRDELAGFGPGGPASVGPPREPRVNEQGEVVSNETVAGSEIAWNSQSGNPGGATGPQNTGRMTSRWFALPRMQPGNVVSFWVAGRPEQGNELAVEFGEATPTRGEGDENSAGEEANPEVGARVFRKQILRDPPATDPPFDDPRHGRPVDWRDFTQWRLLHLDFRDVPRAATHLRVTAVDTSTDPQGWLAVSAPMVRRVVPLPAVLQRQSPMLIDWPISFVFGCRVNYPRVGNGTADSPQVMISPREGPYSMAFDTEVGGVFAGVATVSRYSELPTRLRNAPGNTWGHVYLLNYDMERDAYDQRHWPVVTPGAGGDGEYPFEPH